MSEKNCVLVVDDDEGVRKSLHLILKKKGYLVESAETGKEALAIAQGGLINVTLLDVKLPDIMGTELLAPLKQTNPDMSVIMITGFASVENAVQSLTAGASGYITKPIDLDGMLEKIKTALDQQHLVTEVRKAEDALRESEEKFRGIFDTINDGIHIHEIEPDGKPGKFIEVNEVACRMLQYTREKLLGLGPLNIVSGYHSRPFDEIIGELSTTGHAIFETGHRRKDGTILPVEINAHVVNLQGKRRTVAVIRDITERKQAEQKQKRGEALLKDVSEMAHVGGWELDVKTKEVLWTSETYRIHEISEDKKFDLSNAVKFYDLPGRSTLESALQRCMEKGEPYDLELPFTSSKGRHLWTRSFGRAIRVDGKVVKLAGTFQDITESKRTELKLISAQESLKDAHHLAHIGTWEWSLENDVVTWSEEMYIIAGRETSLAAPTYAEHPRLYAPSSWERLDSAVTRALTTGESYQLELELIRPDNTVRWILAFGGVKRDGEGKVIGLLGTLQDITDRKLMESEIRSLNTVLEQRVKERTEALSKTNVALEEENAQRLEAEGKLQASHNEKVLLLKEIHHRVKNNLQIIVSLLRLQKRQIADTATQQQILDSESRIRSMALVHEKLYRSTNFASIDFEDYLKTLAHQLVPLYATNPGQIRIVIDMKGISVDINQSIPLGLIMNELISNTMKYAFPEGRTGEFSISGMQQGGSKVFTVRDNGIGMPPGFDWHETKSLGMHLVKMLTDQLNGTIELEKGEGTSFRLTLPEKT